MFAINLWYLTSALTEEQEVVPFKGKYNSLQAQNFIKHKQLHPYVAKKIFSTHTKTKFMLEKKPKDDCGTRASLSAEMVLPSPGPVGALIHIDHDTPGVLMRVNCALALRSMRVLVSPCA